MNTNLLKITSIIIAGIILTLPLAAMAMPAGKASTDDIFAYTQEQADRGRIPGAAVGIVSKDGTKAKGFGNMSADSPIIIASLSKSFTALAIMQLVDDGKVSLNDPVVKILPNFRIGDGVGSSKITVRQILNQTSGISTQAGLKALSYGQDMTIDQAIKDITSYPLSQQPGKGFAYSNANFIIAGGIIEEVTKASYGLFVETRIFKPLEMYNSHAVTGTPDMPNYTKGNSNWFGFKVPMTDTVSPALLPDGYLISTANDLSKYLAMLMNDGMHQGKQIVSAAAIKEMFTPQASLGDTGALPRADSYGFGWGVGTYRNNKIISHEGQLRDVQMDMTIFPEQEIAVVTMINENGMLLNEGQINRGILTGVTTGSLPRISNTYYIFYAIFNAVVIASLILMLRSFYKLRSWKTIFSQNNKSKKRAIILLSRDFIVAVCLAFIVFVGLGSMVGMIPLDPVLLMFSLPDVAIWMYSIIAFFIVRGLVKLFIAYRQART